MNECGDKRLKHKRKTIKNKRHSKPWYNKTCETTKRQFEQLAKHAQKFPKNPHTLGQYNKIKWKYKHFIKTIKQKWKIENIRILENFQQYIAFCEKTFNKRRKQMPAYK